MHVMDPESVKAAVPRRVQLSDAWQGDGRVSESGQGGGGGVEAGGCRDGHPDLCPFPPPPSPSPSPLPDTLILYCPFQGVNSEQRDYKPA